MAQPLPECDLTPDLKSVPDQSKLCKDFEFPVFTPEKKYSQELSKYLLSFHNIYSENINGSSLMFVTGPTQTGKSWLLHS